MKVAIPVLEKEVKGKLLVNPHFGKSNFFAVVNVETGKTEKVKNPALNIEKGKGRVISELFSEKGVKAVLVKEIGEGALEKLKSCGIEVFLIPQEVKFVDEAVALFKKGELREIP